MSHLVLVVGLVLFIGIHLFLALRRDTVDALKQTLGRHTWRGIHSLIALTGLVLIVWGFGLTRADPVFLWNPPLWTRHVGALLSAFAILLLVATYVPANHLRTYVGHPMYAAIKLWALAHLIANGRLGDVLLFGTFLVWAIIGFARVRGQDRARGVVYPAGTALGTSATVILGLLVTVAIVFWLHQALIGVPVA